MAEQGLFQNALVNKHCAFYSKFCPRSSAPATEIDGERRSSLFLIKKTQNKCCIFIIIEYEMMILGDGSFYLQSHLVSVCSIRAVCCVSLL